MDWLTLKDRLQITIKKYRYILAVVLLGIIFLIQPAQSTSQQQIPEPTSTEKPDLEMSLSNILCQIAGAGEVEVLLTQAKGEEILYQTDQNISDHSNQRDTVLITGQDRAEGGLIRQRNPPIYLGALVICQGAESPSVRLAIVEAVMSVTGLTSDCVTVLKMK